MQTSERQSSITESPTMTWLHADSLGEAKDDAALLLSSLEACAEGRHITAWFHTNLANTCLNKPATNTQSCHSVPYFTGMTAISNDTSTRLWRPTSLLSLCNLVLVILITVTVTAGNSAISCCAVWTGSTILLGKAALQLSCFLQALFLLLYLLIPAWYKSVIQYSKP